LIKVIVVLLLGLVVVVQRQVDRERDRLSTRSATTYLWTGEQVRRLAPGLEALMADVYWLRTVQYVGGQRVFAGGQTYERLGPLIDITVTLDPRMEIAYRYGAIFLSEPPPQGAGQPRAGLDLLERGVRVMPENWRLQQDLGFYHFLFLKDSRKASEILMAASNLPGAPFWLRTLAADTLVRGGERRAARRIWEALRDQSEGAIKDNAVFQLYVVDALDEADRLTALVRRYEETTHHRPRSLYELVAAGLLPRRPVDPTKVPYEYDANTGEVSVSKSSTLYRPPAIRPADDPSDAR
jgi:hypothetical protein